VARHQRARRRLALAAAAALLLSGTAAAQFFGRQRYEPRITNVPYDGRFAFVRLKYTTAPGGFWYAGLPSWIHGYPTSERNLLSIINEVTLIGGRSDAFNVLALDDPELMRYPLAYMTEAGWWTLTDSETEAFREYLLKGGFVIFDDFKVEGEFGPGGGWDPFEANIRRVLPGARIVDMDPTHKIFHAFFEINSLTDFPQAYNAGPPVFRGVHLDNDPAKRLLMIINYNTDVSQYWEWSGRGFRPFDDTNEAYKLGVNYLIYALTH
jgi:hypothetical protein